MSPRRRTALNPILYVVALLLACGCVVGGVAAYREKQDRDAAEERQDTYGDVLSSGTAFVDAFVNIDYKDVQATIKKVSALSTGAFLKQYETGSASLTDGVLRSKAIQTGEVQWIGVSTLDKDSAAVLALIDGDVANTQTQGKPLPRKYRLKVELALVKGEWLASEVEFVGNR